MIAFQLPYTDDLVPAASNSMFASSRKSAYVQDKSFADPSSANHARR